jgi:acetolactate synthase-1/2/3 large subunit
MVRAVSQFTKGHLDLSEFTIDDLQQSSVVDAVLEQILRLVEETSTPPFGPVLLGVPLDLAEQSWADPSAHHSTGMARLFHQVAEPDQSALRDAVGLLAAAERIGVLVDDYFLHLQGAQEHLAYFSILFASPVFQVGYRRGPMLFPMIDVSVVENFHGRYVPGDDASMRFAQDVNLLVTIEDRNMYRRVVGELPRCRKLAITSARQRTEKNDYLVEDDIILEGNPVAILHHLSAGKDTRPRSPWFTVTGPHSSPGVTRNFAASGAAGSLAERLLELLLVADVRQLVDDSQVFGGAVAAGAAALLPRFEVFGDHGGYVGAGLPFATGLALAAGARVACLLGDHAFVNGSQALFAVARYRPPICVVVCSNGGSVTLAQQARDSYGDDAAARTRDLMAAPDVDLVAFANSLGIAASRVSVTREDDHASLADLDGAVARYAASWQPVLIDIECPSDLDFWAGIWHSYGLDEQRVTS